MSNEFIAKLMRYGIIDVNDTQLNFNKFSARIFAEAYIYSITENNKCKPSLMKIKEEFRSGFSKITSYLNVLDYEIGKIIISQNIIDFLFSKKDRELLSNIGARVGSRYSDETNEAYERRINEAISKIKLIFDSSLNTKLSDVISIKFKKDGFLKDFFGTASEDALGYFVNFNYYLKHKISFPMINEKSLSQKFSIDESSVHLINFIYWRLLHNKEYQHEKYLVNIKSGGERQYKQLLTYLSASSERNMNFGYIYAAHTRVDGKWYVGQTIGDPEKRFWEHRRNKTGPYRTGAEEVTWHILESNIGSDQLNEREKHWIGEKKAYLLGHNRTKGNS